MRKIDQLPMTIRFISDIIKSNPTMDEQKIVNRAHRIATLVAAKFKDDTIKFDPKNTRPMRMYRHQNPSTLHVDNGVDKCGSAVGKSTLV